MILKESIEHFYAQGSSLRDKAGAQQAVHELRFFLNNGEVRAAFPSKGHDELGGWAVNEWVKKGILLGFRVGELTEIHGHELMHFFDKNVFPLRKLTVSHDVRLVPGGSAVRDGAYLGRSVIIMPPSYVNIGAYVDEGTMLDSLVLVGSCAQIGKHVHVSTGARIGGVLEPVQALPVIVEDDVFIGGNTGVFEGTVVKRRAVIAAGVTLTRSTPVYDLVRQTILKATTQVPLIIPEGAVVVPGTRPLTSPYAHQHQLGVATPVIVKYRDAQTDAATAIEEALR
ncbi:MAG: 2,3,4,5-tetrahydropyridine-2,6-dicarboxylate N-succinyltransferase [Bacteroidetes bacterium]|nr:2,3,4,5-tetrahydropyridine-2,6-dicarboxylate N-succinyltransferase [Bacteroidota bacterium]